MNAPPTNFFSLQLSGNISPSTKQMARPDKTRLALASPVLAMLIVASAHASDTIYKCTVDDKAVYQPTPCASGKGKSIAVNASVQPTLTIWPHQRGSFITNITISTTITPNTPVTLIGMSVLSQFDVRTENGALTLRRK